MYFIGTIHNASAYGHDYGITIPVIWQTATKQKILFGLPDAPPAGTYRVLLSARLAAALIMGGLLRADGFCRPFISRCRYAVCTCTFVCRRAQQLCMGSIRPHVRIDAIPRKQIGQLLTGSSPFCRPSGQLFSFAPPPSCRLPAMSPAHNMLRAGFE